MESSTEKSVQQLLGDLCKSIYRDCTQAQNANAHNSFLPAGIFHENTPTTIPPKLLRTCKQRANEILLKRMHKQPLPEGLLATDEGFSEIIDPIRELKFCQFVHNIHVAQMRPLFEDFAVMNQREYRRIMDKHDFYEKCIQTVVSEDYFRLEQSDGYAILKVLVSLKNGCPDDGGEKSLFALDLNAVPTFPKIEPKFFKLNWNPNDELLNNPYCSSMHKLNSTTNLFELCSVSAAATPTHPLSLIKTSRMQQKTSSPKKAQRRCTLFYTAKSWKHLGLRIPLDGSAESDTLLTSIREPKFLTETIDGSMNATGFLETRNCNESIVRVMNERLFIEQIKFMLVGIESDSFAYDANSMSFRMLEHLTLDNILPLTALGFVDVFIECGTCYKRLKVIVQRNTSGHKQYHGFLFKVILSRE